MNGVYVRENLRNRREPKETKGRSLGYKREKSQQGREDGGIARRKHAFVYMVTSSDVSQILRRTRKRKGSRKFKQCPE